MICKSGRRLHLHQLCQGSNEEAKKEDAHSHDPHGHQALHCVDGSNIAIACMQQDPFSNAGLTLESISSYTNLVKGTGQRGACYCWIYHVQHFCNPST